MDPPLLRVLTMAIEDTLARHYQAENLPAGHPVREAIDELRRLRAEVETLRRPQAYDAAGYPRMAVDSGAPGGDISAVYGYLPDGTLWVRHGSATLDIPSETPK